MATAWMIALFLGLAAAGVPVCAAMGMSAFLGLALIDAPLDTFVRYMQHDVRSVPLLAIPFFILAGNVMNVFGLTRRIFGVHRKPGRLDARGLGAGHGALQRHVRRHLGLGARRHRRHRRDADRCHEKGRLPRPVRRRPHARRVAARPADPAFHHVHHLRGDDERLGRRSLHRRDHPGTDDGRDPCGQQLRPRRRRLGDVSPPKPFAWRKAWSAFWIGLPALLTPIIILRSMITGLTTPTEASVLAVVYALFLGVLYREISWKGLREAFGQSARTTALIMFLTGVGSVMSFVITSDQVAEHMARWLGGLTESKWAILCMVTLALLVLGCFMETVPAMLIGIPLFGPLVVKFGIDPIHFGVVLTYVLLLGIVHPPIGLGLFAVCAISRLSIESVTWATMKFYPAFIVVLLLLMFIPELSTWLPAVVFAK